MRVMNLLMAAGASAVLLIQDPESHGSSEDACTACHNGAFGVKVIAKAPAANDVTCTAAKYSGGWKATAKDSVKGSLPTADFTKDTDHCTCVPNNPNKQGQMTCDRTHQEPLGYSAGASGHQSVNNNL